jgi:hypothetical protein
LKYPTSSAADTLHHRRATKPNRHSSELHEVPATRANILDTDMDSAGIGVADRNGQLFAVEDFSKAK